ncbi:DUF429 domain-containing protein [Methyloversatilis thermotolerans]|uniref:DUF429 domain-containing protein n=1 Tax=Methyloversatilis thermotolerans TaxID=1346290 RepID=UPI0003798D1E|nr:DUF429 domain-containing protein [Methyloversatilis thermotolerans]
MTTLYGIDFTSSPSARKPVNVARGEVEGDTLVLTGFERFPSWAGFEAFLARPGPWLGGFDFPFGLPRESVLEHGWPQDWAGLVRAISALGRQDFKALADAERALRPVGRKYPHRATDLPASSHSPLKFVNPPVGWMFLEGCSRLLAANVHVPGMHGGDADRIALEAYPGWLARQITGGSYKSESASGQTRERLARRMILSEALLRGAHPLGLPLRCESQELLDAMNTDGTGDTLDSVLCLVQAAWAWQRRDQGYGLPLHIDPVEGWIIGVPLQSAPVALTAH